MKVEKWTSIARFSGFHAGSASFLSKKREKTTSKQITYNIFSTYAALNTKITIMKGIFVQRKWFSFIRCSVTTKIAGGYFSM